MEGRLALISYDHLTFHYTPSLISRLVLLFRYWPNDEGIDNILLALKLSDNIMAVPQLICGNSFTSKHLFFSLLSSMLHQLTFLRLRFETSQKQGQLSANFSANWFFLSPPLSRDVVTTSKFVLKCNRLVMLVYIVTVWVL